MDKSRTLAAFLSSGLTFALIGAAELTASAPIAPPLREANWIAKDRRFAALSEAPAECVKLPKDRSEREAVALGRQLFRNPLLLGGQAARAGLSCAACHRNGRGNPDFLFPALSGAAGTADVTSSLMSRTRGDGMANAKPIPDLAFDPPKLSRAPGDPALSAFIRGLVVEEFDGLEPAPRTLEALTAYVRAIQPEGCQADKSQPQTLSHNMGELVLGLSVARREAERGDGSLARLVLGGVRDQLGQLAARYPSNNVLQKAFGKLDKRLAGLQAKIGGQPAKAAMLLDQWQDQLSKLHDALILAEPASLYNPGRLSAYLNVYPKP